MTSALDLGALLSWARPRVLLYLRRFGRDTAEDAFQAAALALWQRPPLDATTDDQRCAWLCRTARHAAIDSCRRVKRRGGVAPTSPRDYARPSPEAERLVSRFEAREALAVGLRRLRRARCRREARALALALRLSITEGAARMGLSRGGFKTLTHRARADVAGLLSDL